MAGAECGCGRQGAAARAAEEQGVRGEEVAAALLPAARLPPVTVDGEELQDARWFPAAWLRAALAGAARCPLVDFGPGAQGLPALYERGLARGHYCHLCSIGLFLQPLAWILQRNKCLPKSRLVRAMLEVTPQTWNAQA